ncbi:tetratricopeptide repeat protein [Pontixanthobacter sp.]|uniref:tetratricopeptide repeat protein n=1 Tax=Pontixanthobacter sp. TaxID=2792078 RepID=UPI003C7D2F25
MNILEKPVLRALLTSAVGVSLFLTAACDGAPSDPYAAAVQASEDGDFQASRLFLQKALDAEPDNAAAIMLYGKTQLVLENPEGAAEQFKKLANNPEFSAEANDLLAKAYVQSGNSKLAFEALETNGMNSGIAYAVSVVAHLSDGNADSAVAMLDQGLAKFPDAPDLRVLDAKRSFDSRKLSKARSTLASVIDEDPMMMEARLLLGRLEMGERSLDKAKEQFAQVVRINPWNLPAILSLAAIARDEGDEETAADWLNRAKEISPGHPVGVYFAAQMAYDAGNVDQAHILVQSLGTKSAEFPALRLLRGMISAQRGQTHTAISELERFFRLGGESAPARIALASQYNATGANQKAWEMLQPVLQSSNANAGALALGANLASKLGRPEQAKLAQRAAQAQGVDPFAANMVKAGAAMRAGKWKEADTIYQKVLKAGGNTNPVILNNAAYARLKTGDKQGAVSLARKAVKLSPDDPIILDTLGWSLVQLDPQSSEGRDLIRRALDLAPGNREIAEHWVAVS